MVLNFLTTLLFFCSFSIYWLLFILLLLYNHFTLGNGKYEEIMWWKWKKKREKILRNCIFDFVTCVIRKTDNVFQFLPMIEPRTSGCLGKNIPFLHFMSSHNANRPDREKINYNAQNWHIILIQHILGYPPSWQCSQLKHNWIQKQPLSDIYSILTG